MFLPHSNDHRFCLLRVDGHEVISSPIEHLVSRKMKSKTNVAMTCFRHMNTLVSSANISRVP